MPTKVRKYRSVKILADSARDQEIILPHLHGEIGEWGVAERGDKPRAETVYGYSGQQLETRRAATGFAPA